MMKYIWISDIVGERTDEEVEDRTRKMIEFGFGVSTPDYFGYDGIIVLVVE